MDILFLVLIAIAGIVALVLIIRFLGGCILKVLLALAVVAVIAFLVFFLLRC
jgi:hypothetical protein